MIKEIRTTGDMNVGHRNTGHRNTGNWNTGNWNTGDRNVGDMNVGHGNTGDMNVGRMNTGDTNTGDKNTGDKNTGDRNVGDKNTGDGNIGNYHSGCLCFGEAPFYLFNQKADRKKVDFSKVYDLSCLLLKDDPIDPVPFLLLPNATKTAIKKLHGEHIKSRKKANKTL